MEVADIEIDSSTFYVSIRLDTSRKQRFLDFWEAAAEVRALNLSRLGHEAGTRATEKFIESLWKVQAKAHQWLAWNKQGNIFCKFLRFCINWAQIKFEFSFISIQQNVRQHFSAKKFNFQLPIITWNNQCWNSEKDIETWQRKYCHCEIIEHELIAIPSSEAINING